MGKKRLSVFIDESGILNDSPSTSRFYILTLVLHDQDFTIDAQSADLDRELELIGIANLCFHAGPVIRANDRFEFMNWDLRRKIFSRMLGFARRVNFQYHCLDVDKKFIDTTDSIIDRLRRQLDDFISSHQNFLSGFTDIKIYYDCGQKQITNLLTDFFKTRTFLSVEFAQAVEPRKYRLFQVADLVCTLHLIDKKLQCGLPLSPSESKFFGGAKRFRHDVLRRIQSKAF